MLPDQLLSQEQWRRPVGTVITDYPIKDGEGWTRTGDPLDLTVKPSIGIGGKPGGGWKYHGTSSQLLGGMMADSQCPDAFIFETISLDKQLRFLDNKVSSARTELEMLELCQETIRLALNKRVEKIEEAELGAKYRLALYQHGLMKGP